MADNTKRLTPERRKHLLDQWAKGISQSELAAAFNISQSSVSYLVRRYVGAEPGKQVVRMLPGTALRDLRGRLQDTLNDLDRIRRDVRAMLALSGAVPTPEIEEQSAPGSPWAKLNVLAMDGESAQFVNGLIYFEGDALDLDEFWRRFPKGIARDAGEGGGLLTYDEAVDLLAELEGDLDHIPLTSPGEDEEDEPGSDFLTMMREQLIRDDPTPAAYDEKAARAPTPKRRKSTTAKLADEIPAVWKGADEAFYRRAMKALK